MKYEHYPDETKRQNISDNHLLWDTENNLTEVECRVESAKVDSHSPHKLKIKANKKLP